MITQQHLDLLRAIARTAQETDQDIGLSANVVTALLDEIADLRKRIDEYDRRMADIRPAIRKTANKFGRI